MKEKEEKVYDNYYCVIDGYIDTIVGPYPKMVFIPGRVLAIEYCALSCLLYDFETYLEEHGYDELLARLKDYKMDADEMIKESEAYNDFAQ
jgi:hypothetical protein